MLWTDLTENYPSNKRDTWCGEFCGVGGVAKFKACRMMGQVRVTGWRSLGKEQIIRTGEEGCGGMARYMEVNKKKLGDEIGSHRLINLATAWLKKQI